VPDKILGVTHQKKSFPDPLPEKFLKKFFWCDTPKIFFFPFSKIFSSYT